jgi:D-alanine transaminase
MIVDCWEDFLMKVLWNDKIVDRKDVVIDIEDRGYQYGDGLYEVIRIYNGKYFMLEEHLDRFWKGAEKVYLTIPFTRAALVSRLHELLAVSEITDGKIYFQLTRGITSPRTPYFPDPKQVSGTFTANITAFTRPTAVQEKGIKVAKIPDMRWLHCDVKSISLLGNLLAQEEAHRAQADDSVQLRDGFVTEASAANFWMIKDRVLYTHPDSNLVLPGISKMHVRDLAKQLGFVVSETPFTYEQLLLADEAFITSTTKEVVPVVAVDGQKLSGGVRGPIVEQLQKAYVASIED